MLNIYIGNYDTTKCHFITLTIYKYGIIYNHHYINRRSSRKIKLFELSRLKATAMVMLTGIAWTPALGTKNELRELLLIADYYGFRGNSIHLCDTAVGG
jgi:hypothetical protein